MQVAGDMDDVPFVMAKEDAIFTEHSVSGDAVVLFKKVRHRREDGVIGVKMASSLTYDKTKYQLGRHTMT